MMIVGAGGTFGGFTLYCTHCKHEFSGTPEKVYHYRYDELGRRILEAAQVIREDGRFLDRIKTCPNAGKTFRAPGAVEVL